MDRDMKTSKVSLERSFAELQNGHGFCYVFLIAWMWNTNKQVVCFFFAIKMKAGYGCFLQTYIVGIFKSADIKNWWHKKTALQDLFRPFFRIGITFLGEKLCRFFKPQNAWNTLYKTDAGTRISVAAVIGCFCSPVCIDIVLRGCLSRSWYEAD